MFSNVPVMSLDKYNFKLLSLLSGIPVDKQILPNVIDSAVKSFKAMCIAHF